MNSKCFSSISDSSIFFLKEPERKKFLPINLMKYKLHCFSLKSHSYLPSLRIFAYHEVRKTVSYVLF